MKKRKNINYVVNETIEEFGNVRVYCRLQEITEQLGLSILQLANLTGIRYASLHELKSGKKVTLNLQHTLAIMIALRIKSFDDLFVLEFDEAEKAEQFIIENLEIHDQKKGLPTEIFAKIKANEVKLETYYEELHKQKNLE